MKFLRLILFFIFFYFGFFLFGFSEEEKLKGGVVSYYCTTVNPQSLNCQEWKLILQQKFEVEERIFRKIKEKKIKVKSVSTFCLNISPKDEECQIWKSLRQKHLELKGSLINEIKVFCHQNPQHTFCKSAKRLVPKD
ncbi:MAG: hypothetical protein N3A56_06905 [Thermodesulfobacteriaceae bacterium]|nr:hypothetical protein [Thermodesulfobacteriaceae bacterium]MDW8136436.1 hypothetical protein [Thermodesulfobacterium sp.]